MNVNLPAITNLNSGTAKLRKSSQPVTETVAPGRFEQLAKPQAQKVRVFKVAPDGIDVAHFSTGHQSTNGALSNQQQPTKQYLANQNLLQQEEITNLLGIDLFA